MKFLEIHARPKNTPGKEDMLESQVESLFIGTGFLNLHWLNQALDVLLSFHTSIHDQLLTLRNSSDRASMTSVFIEDNTTLLEVCNLAKKSISVSAQSKLHVKYAIRSLSECWEMDQPKLLKVRQSLQECIEELEKGSTSLQQHTGSWLDSSSHSNNKLGDIKTNKTGKKASIPSKARDANLMSLVVFTALLTAFNPPGGVGGYVDQARLVASQQGLGCVKRLRDGIREEAVSQGAKTATAAPVLESLRSSLMQILELVDSWLASPERMISADMKQLIHHANKRLEYFESSLGILEEQLDLLFRKLVEHRKVILSGNTNL